jgi:hypothetical protein
VKTTKEEKGRKSQEEERKSKKMKEEERSRKETTKNDRLEISTRNTTWQKRGWWRSARVIRVVRRIPVGKSGFFRVIRGY